MRQNPWLFLCTLLALSACATAYAQDATLKAMQDAMKAYKAGDAIAAKAQLDDASAMIAKSMTKKLEAFLPPPLKDWTIDDTQIASDPALAGGGLNASRTYALEDERITISITGDTPMLAALAQAFADKERARGGERVLQIKGQSAVMTEDGQVQVLIANRFIVIAEGTASEEIKTEYLNKIDVEGLSKF